MLELLYFPLKLILVLLTRDSEGLLDKNMGSMFSFLKMSLLSSLMLLPSVGLCLGLYFRDWYSNSLILLERSLNKDKASEYDCFLLVCSHP